MSIKMKVNIGKTKLHSKVPHLVIALALVVSVSWAMIPLTNVSATTQIEEFIESDAFIVPAGVAEITIKAWGSGGAGGGSTSAGGGSGRGGAGGGGGAYASSTLTVEPGLELQVVVGTEGAGVSGANGTDGGPSFVGLDTNPANALVRAAGGSGGTGNTAGGDPVGGAGGTVEDSIGQTRIAGANGEDGATGKACRSGAGGEGAYHGGDGGAALTSGNEDGNLGSTPGGGGGGARTQGNGGARIGGAGAAGKIVITWVTYDLTISSTEGGSVTTPGEGTFTCGEEAVVDLVAEADEGYQFGKWTGNVNTIADVNTAATNIIMNGDYSITANFEEIQSVQYELTTFSTAGGSVTTPGEGVSVYDEGTVVDLVAEVEEGYQFANWTGDASTIADAEDTVTTITMHDNYEITANFEEDSPSPPPSGGCFIATAAYGTPTAEQIDVLREFRDIVLLESIPGSQFVALYYQFSPPVADFITGNELLRTMIRELLIDPIVWAVEATGDIWRN